jgi:hypothetical protein
VAVGSGNSDETSPPHAAASEREDVLTRIEEFAANARYPIEDLESLVDALGGADARVIIRGTAMRLSEARALVPAYYFPIGSEPDLIAKIADLRELGGRNEQQFVAEWLERRSGSENGPAPADCWA